MRFYNRQLMSFGVPYKKESFEDKTLKLTRASTLLNKETKWKGLLFRRRCQRNLTNFALLFIYPTLCINLFIPIDVYMFIYNFLIFICASVLYIIDYG